MEEMKTRRRVCMTADGSVAMTNKVKCTGQIRTIY